MRLSEHEIEILQKLGVNTLEKQGFVCDDSFMRSPRVEPFSPEKLSSVQWKSCKENNMEKSGIINCGFGCVVDVTAGEVTAENDFFNEKVAQHRRKFMQEHSGKEFDDKFD